MSVQSVVIDPLECLWILDTDCPLFRPAEYGGLKLICIDLMWMPQMNGFEVIAYMKSTELRVPVVVVSAVSQQALKSLDYDVVKLVISKPFDVHEFTEKIAALCEQPSS